LYEAPGEAHFPQKPLAGTAQLRLTPRCSQGHDEEAGTRACTFIMRGALRGGAGSLTPSDTCDDAGNHTHGFARAVRAREPETIVPVLQAIVEIKRAKRV
jgi:hypothetical protein